MSGVRTLVPALFEKTQRKQNIELIFFLKLKRFFHPGLQIFYTIKAGQHIVIDDECREQSVLDFIYLKHGSDGGKIDAVIKRIYSIFPDIYRAGRRALSPVSR